jgi:ketosteroid isomerase-like protein
MKLTWILLLLSFAAHAQDKDIDAIRAVFAKQQKAWNNGNLEAFMEGYWKSDSLKFIGSRGVNYGWQATLESYKKGYPDRETMGELTFSIISFEKLSKSNIFIIGKYRLKRSTDSPGGYFTLLWKKIKGQWVIVVDHSS